MKYKSVCDTSGQFSVESMGKGLVVNSEQQSDVSRQLTSNSPANVFIQGLETAFYRILTQFLETRKDCTNVRGIKRQRGAILATSSTSVVEESALVRGTVILKGIQESSTQSFENTGFEERADESASEGILYNGRSVGCLFRNVTNGSEGIDARGAVSGSMLNFSRGRKQLLLASGEATAAGTVGSHTYGTSNCLLQ